MEQELGVPVILGQQSAHWYSLNVAECYEARRGMGALLGIELAKSAVVPVAENHYR
jgi:maleate cis-trans isomerase